MKIIILYDQAPPEAGPDLADNTTQASEVAAALKSLGHETTAAAMTDPAGAAEELKRLRPDLVFNLVEAPGGQGRLIGSAPALLDKLGLRYTGARTEAMVATSDKPEAKRRLRRAGLPTPNWIDPAASAADPADAGRYIIKSSWEHGSVGLEQGSVVTGGDLERLLAEMELRRPSLGGECFAEEYIEGREFNISLLAGPYGPEVLPPAEIVFEDFGSDRLKIVGYQAKWSPEAFEYNHTPRSFKFGPADRGLIETLGDLSLACWRLFDLRGWARVDFRVDRSGRPLILEVNANPCLASDAGFMASAARRGLNQADVVDRIVFDALAGAPRGSGRRAA